METNLSNLSFPSLSSQEDEGPPFTLREAVIILLGIGFFLFSVVGNLLVVLAFLVDRNVRTPSNLFIASLALVDMFVGIFPITFGITYNYYKKWHYGLGFCKFWVSCCYSLSIISSTHLVLIASDRYRILFQGVSYIQEATMARNLVSILLSWAFGWFVTLPVFWSWDEMSVDPTANFHCVVKKTPTWVILTLSSSFLLPGFLLLRLYHRIFTEIKTRIRKRGARMTSSPMPSTSNQVSNQTDDTSFTPTPKCLLTINSHETLSLGTLVETDCDLRARKALVLLQQERRAALTLGILIAFFFICWTPYFTLAFLDAFFPDIKPNRIYFVITAILGWVNSCVNPIVYARRSKDFQNAFKKMVRFRF